MDGDDLDKRVPGEDGRPSGLSSQVLDYYKRYGRHRDLEQYFSLNTVQEGPSTSEKQDQGSPPIMSEDPAAPPNFTVEKDDERKSDLDTSHKSVDLNLDNSMNKPQSPTSSITSQRKLEWDSLADVGYANEIYRKVSSNLSTVERLALQQQFSISDEIKEISGHPTAYSTPLDEGDSKRKSFKKGLLKKVTEITQKDVDVMEVNVDKGQTRNTPNINFSLTKHISFHVDPETGAASIANSKTEQDISVQPEILKTSENVKLQEALDKEIQTSFHSTCPDPMNKTPLKKKPDCFATVPVLLNLDMLKQARYKGLRYYKTKLNRRKKKCTSQQRLRRESGVTGGQHEKVIPAAEVTIGCSQVSETDSFEYMPGHVYHQNRARNRNNEQSTSNKTSSLDSSGGCTTVSSRQSEHSLSRDLENSIALLNKLIQHRHQDVDLKKKLVKQLVHKLIKTNYRNDETTTDFLSGLSFNSNLLGIGPKNKLKYNTTTSTSDGNNSVDACTSKSRKPILRSSKTPTKSSVDVTRIFKEVVAQIHSPPKIKVINNSNTSDSTTVTTGSGQNTYKEKSTSERLHPKTSSEQLYQYYLEALKKEQKYKQQLQNKQEWLKQKLIKKPTTQHIVEVENLKASSMKGLVKDLTNMNMSKSTENAGDAPQSNPESYRNWNQTPRLRSHSVFTMSSAITDKISNRPSSSKDMCSERSPLGKKESLSSRIEDKNIEKCDWPSRLNKGYLHYCCCPYHTTEEKADSTLKEHNKANEEEFKKIIQSEDILKLNLPSTSNNKIVCFCSSDRKVLDDIPDNFLIYKCCKPPCNANPKLQGDVESKKSVSIQCSDDEICKLPIGSFKRNESPFYSSNYLANANEIDTEKSKFYSEENIYRNRSLATGDSNVYRIDHQSARVIPTEKNTDMYTGSSKFTIPKMHSVPQTSRVHLPQHRRLSDTMNLIEKLNSFGLVNTCIQTSVSIDPKVSEPTLADINVLSEELTRSEKRPEIFKYCETTSTDAFVTSENPFSHNPYLVAKSSKKNMSRRQPETGAILDQIFGCDEVSNKSKDSHCSKQSFDENLFSYLDEEKSVDSPEPSDGYTQAVDKREHPNQMLEESVHKQEVVESLYIQEKVFHAMEQAVGTLQEQATSMTDLKKETSTHDVRAGPSSKSSKHLIGQTCSLSRDVSTQITPREEKCHSKMKETSIKEDSCKSSQTKVLSEKASNDYTNEWIEKRNKRTSAIVGSLIAEYDSENDKPRDPKTVISATQSSSGRIRNKNSIENDNQTRNKKFSDSSETKTSEINSSGSTVTKESLLESIEDIIRRYGKDKLTTADKRKSRHKHYKDIINKLHYLLRTENVSADELSSVLSTEAGKDFKVIETQTTSQTNTNHEPKNKSKPFLVDKSTQLKGNSHTKIHREHIVYTAAIPNTRVLIKDESSDLPTSTDVPDTSETSFTCHVINKIRKECDKYHKKHCKCVLHDLSNTGYEASSSTSVPRRHSETRHTCKSRCTRSHMTENCKRKSIAYNLILQPSDHGTFQNPPHQTNQKERKLKDVIVKVPSVPKSVSQRTFKSKSRVNVTVSRDEVEPEDEVIKEHLKESEDKLRSAKHSATESESDLNVGVGTAGGNEVRKIKFLTVREYLQRNRPDFINNSSERLNCLQAISESRKQRHNLQRQLVSLQLEEGEGERVAQLREIARRLRQELRHKRPEKKLIDERAMKHHSRKIYKSLPEVVQKKEKFKKNNIKRTNLILTNLFNKNLQKKTLRGVVDISNYSPVITI